MDGLNLGRNSLDGLFVGVSIGETIRIVAKHDVGSIGSVSNRNQVICCFLVKAGPFKVCLFDDTIDLGQGESSNFAQSLGLGSMHLSKELFGARQVVSSEVQRGWDPAHSLPWWVIIWRFCCWLLSKTKQGEFEKRAQVVTRRMQSKQQQVSQQVHSWRGDSIVLQFVGLINLVGVLLTDLLDALCENCWALHTWFGLVW